MSVEKLAGAIAARFADQPRLKDRIAVVRGLERFNEADRKAVFTKDDLPGSAFRGRRYVRFAPATAVASYAVEWRGSYVDSALFSRARKEQFARPKLIFASHAPRLRVAFDERGFYVGSALFTTAAVPELALGFVAGLLNSSMGDLFFRHYNELPRGAGPELLTAGRLASLPVVLPNDEAGQKLVRFIDGNVRALVHAARSRALLMGLWRRSAEALPVSATLGQLLANQMPGQDAPWIARVVPSLATLRKWQRLFSGVRLVADPEAPLFRLYGQRDTGTESMLAEIEFAEPRLMHYLALATANLTLPRPMRLSAILNRVRVPIAQAHQRASGLDLLSRLAQRMGHESAVEEIPQAESDLMRLDRMIDERTALVDAEVFRLCGLSWEEAQAVLTWRQCISAEADRVKKYFLRVTAESDD